MCRRFLPFFCAVLALLLQGASVNAREALLHQFFVGDTAVWVLSLGWKEDPTTILRPASEEDKAILVRDYPQGKVRNSQNVLLIRDKKHVILVDAGPAQSADELYASLLRAGTSPEAVTHVISRTRTPITPAASCAGARRPSPGPAFFSPRPRSTIG